MKITASGGTDAAGIVLFWPDNLPADADSALKDNPIALIETLHEQGQLLRFPCDGDGGFTLAIFLQQDIPDDLILYCEEEEQVPVLRVRGVGYFGGMEYMFKHDSSSLDRYPGMCEQVKIPDGTYSARIFCTDTPDHLYESWLTREVGIRAKRLWDIQNAISAFAIMSLLLTLITVFFAFWTLSFFFLAIAVTLIFFAVRMSRTDWYQSVRNAQNSFAQSYPSYVVQIM